MVNNFLFQKKAWNDAKLAFVRPKQVLISLPMQTAIPAMQKKILYLGEKLSFKRCQAVFSIAMTSFSFWIIF